LRATLEHWQKTVWKVVSAPGAEVMMTLAVVMLATWFLLEDGAVLHGAGFPLFAHR
jgi:hypothetical protein